MNLDVVATGERIVDPHTKASLLWGVVGALAFLVLVQGYRLAGGEPVDLSVLVGVTALVGVAAAGLSYLLEERVGPNQSP